MHSDMRINHFNVPRNCSKSQKQVFVLMWKSAPVIEKLNRFIVLHLSQTLAQCRLRHESRQADRMWGRREHAKHVSQTWCGSLERTQRLHPGGTWPPRPWTEDAKANQSLWVRASEARADNAIFNDISEVVVLIWQGSVSKIVPAEL